MGMGLGGGSSGGLRPGGVRRSALYTLLFPVVPDMFPQMRHLAFFEAIAEHPDQGDPLWVESVSGMLVLRFFEEWLDSPALASVNEPGIGRMQGLIEEIENPEIRYLLGTAVRVLMEAEGGRPSLVVGPLLAYARYLDEEGRDVLAIDVLHTVAEAVNPPDGAGDFRLAAQIYLRIGALAIRSRQFDVAEANHKTAIGLGELLDDRAIVLEANIAQAMVTTMRGNLGEAEASLTALIQQARSAGIPWLEARGRHIRGSAIQRRGRAGEALRDFYAAYPIAPNELMREMLLNDMAACAAELGLWRTARIVHRTLAQTAQSEAARSAALINLLEVAIWDKDQAAFQAAWRQLGQCKIPGDLQLHAEWYYAQGIEYWEEHQVAVEAYTNVVKRAKEVGVHEIEFRALQALDRLQSADSQPPVQTEPTSPVSTSEWQDVAEAIEAICELKMHAAST